MKVQSNKIQSAVALMIGLVASLVIAACSSETDGPEVMEQPVSDTTVTAGGETLRGERLEADTGLMVFRGIPFAAPPVGELRWRPPAPHSPRSGVQDATSFGNVCPQTQSNAEWYQDVASRFGVSPEPTFRTGNIDEDCLYLNVWTTAAGSDDLQPVMVWIHGGGNRDGYGHEPDYHGHSLAGKGVVYVSINYRLALLGYMAHPGLSAESEHGVSGNYGILDQIAALRWVQDNIAAFGGDPDNVTVFGESAGGANTATMIVSPLSKGLFHRAIIQSGGYGTNSFHSLADAEAVGAAVASALDIDPSLSDPDVVASLRGMEWTTFVGNPDLRDAPSARALNIDGYVIQQSKAGSFSAGTYNHVPLLIGTNANESYMYLPAGASEEQFASRLASYGEPFATELKELLADDIESDLVMAMDRFGSAASYLCGSRFIADSMSASGDDVFVYYLTRVRPGGQDVLAYHGAEIPYALDTAADWLPSDETDKQLTAAMSRYWVNFAKTGNPNGNGLPEWPHYDNETRPYLELGDEIKPVDDLEPEICGILDRVRDENLRQSRQAGD